MECKHNEKDIHKIEAQSSIKRDVRFGMKVCSEKGPRVNFHDVGEARHNNCRANNSSIGAVTP